MKGILFAFTCLFLLSCSVDENKRREKLMADIDKMPVTQKVFKVETDSIGTTIDTIKIELFKEARDGKKRYREVRRPSKYGDFYEKYYYTLDEKILQVDTYFPKDSLESRYVNIFNIAHEIEESFLVYDEEKSDTVWMDYSRTYFKNGNEKELVIRSRNSEIDFLSNVIFYTEFGRASKEIIILNGDTSKTQYWFYNDSILTKQIITDYSEDIPSRLIFHFGKHEEVLFEERFKVHNKDSIYTTSNINYFMDDKMVRTIEINCQDGKIRYFHYI